jgi:hypothetical protein
MIFRANELVEPDYLIAKTAYWRDLILGVEFAFRRGRRLFVICSLVVRPLPLPSPWGYFGCNLFILNDLAG